MNFKRYNTKNQNTEVCQYLMGALGYFTPEVCLADTTFQIRLREAVAEKAAYILSKSNFYGLKAREEMDDLVQDFFYHVVERLNQIKVGGNLNGWLYTTANRYFIDRSKTSHAYTVESDSFILLNVDVEECFSQISMARDFLATLVDDEKYSKDLKQRLLIGEAFDNLSAEFGISVSTLKKVKARLKKQLTEWVEKNGY